MVRRSRFCHAGKRRWKSGTFLSRRRTFTGPRGRGPFHVDRRGHRAYNAVSASVPKFEIAVLHTVLSLFAHIPQG